MNMLLAEDVISGAFAALTEKGHGDSWKDREAANFHARTAAFMAQAAAGPILDTALEAVRKLKPGGMRKGTNADYTFEVSAGDREHMTVTVTDRSGRGEWTVDRATGRHGSRFTIRQIDNGGEGTESILAIGEWRKSASTGTEGGHQYSVFNCTPGRAGIHALLKLVDVMRADMPASATPAIMRSHPASAVLEADGGIPGANCRRLYRLLHEETCRRTLGWAAGLFDETARLLAEEGAWWGSEALAWTYGHEARFPKFDMPTTFAALVPREGRSTTAIVFRDARPYIETETCLAWREIGGDGRPGTVNLLPLGEEAVEDIEEFIASGGVPAISFDPSTGSVRITERAMSSNALETFATHVGEAWSVMRDRPLYGNPSDRRIFTSDFSVFDRIEPWTKRGRRLAETKSASSETTKGPRR